MDKRNKIKQDFNKLYCTNRYSVGKVHIAETDSSSESRDDIRELLCRKKLRTVFIKLSKIFIPVFPNKKSPAIKYSQLCKDCIRSLSKENQETLKHNAIVAKLKG